MPKPKQIQAAFSLPAQLDLQAAAAPDAAPEFTLVANTGVPMQLAGFYDPVVIDMAGAKFDKDKTPVIMDHDVSKRIGHTTDQRIEPSRITARGVVSSAMGVAQGFVQDAKAGFPFQTSVGASILDALYIDEDQSYTVNGQTYQGPLLVAKKTLIRELSVTVLGADSNTSATIQAHALDGHTLSLKEKPMDEFQKWLAAMGLEHDKLSDEIRAKLKTDFEARQKPATPPPLPSKREPTVDLAGQRDVLAAEEERMDAIRALFARYDDVETVTLEADKPLKVASFKAKALREGWTPDRVELTLIRAERPAPRGPAIHDATPTLNAAAFSVGVQRAFGVPARAKNAITGKEYGYETQYPQAALEAADHRLYQAPTLHQLMDMAIHAAGLSYAGNRRDSQYLATFGRAERMLKAAASGPFSTLSVSYILEDAANKMLMAQYDAQEVVWPNLCAIKSSVDFKPQKFYRLNISGNYQEVGPTGELKHGRFDDEKWTLEMSTYGLMLGLARKDMINDDLNAFAAIPGALGRQAALALEEAVFTALLGSGSFTTGNNNLISDDLDIAGLTNAAMTFRNRVDGNGRPIIVSPRILLVGTQDEIPANDLMTKSLLLPDPAATAREFANNPHVGKYRVVTTPYLNNTDIRGVNGAALGNQDSDQWFLLCDPNVLAFLAVTFLNGRRTPVIESADSSFDTLGMQWRSYHDWGVGELDPQGALKSLGDGSSL